MTSAEPTVERSRTVNWTDPMIGAGLARTMSGLEYMQAMIAGQVPPPSRG